MKLEYVLSPNLQILGSRLSIIYIIPVADRVLISRCSLSQEIVQRCPSADEWIRKLWYIYTMEYYSAINKNSFESVLMRWMKLEHIIRSEVSQKDKDHYSIITHIYGIQKDGNDNPICKTEKETKMYRTDFWTLWEKARVGCFERTASKHVYYLE